MVQIPDSLTRFLRAHFPTLPIRQSWLSECVEYLRTEEGVQSDSQLNALTLNQILLADLKDVASHSVLPDGIEALAKGTIGSLTELHKTSVLVQIISLTDVGVSAQNQIDVLEARKAIKNSPGMAALLNTQNNAESNAAGAAQNVTQATGGIDDHMRAFGEQEQEIQRSSTVFSRSMLQLHVSDGHSPPIPAFERTKIPGLDQTSTLLGCKLLLKGAQVRRGQITLEPKCVVIKGGSVPEWTEGADLVMMNMLRRRINKPPLEADRPRARIDQEQLDLQPNADSDEEAALAMQEEEERSRANRQNHQSPGGRQQIRSSTATGGSANANSRNHNQNQNQNQNQRRLPTPSFDDEDDDELFAMIDENEVLGSENTRTQQRQGRSGNISQDIEDWVGDNEIIELSD